MNSSLTDVAAAVRLSRGTLRNIHENLFWAFFYNVICIPLAAGLYAWKMNPMVGAAAMSLSSFTVCMNALRLNLFRLRDPSRDKPVKRRSKAACACGPAEHSTGNNAACGGENAACGINEKSNSERGNDMTKTVKIEGMMCGHCEATVKKALEKLPYVESAEVSHEKGTAVVTLCGELNEAEVKEAIEDRDFTFIGVE